MSDLAPSASALIRNLIFELRERMDAAGVPAKTQQLVTETCSKHFLSARNRERVINLEQAR